jgi:hypothetical protein
MNLKGVVGGQRKLKLTMVTQGHEPARVKMIVGDE